MVAELPRFSFPSNGDDRKTAHQDFIELARSRLTSRPAWRISIDILSVLCLVTLVIRGVRPLLTSWTSTRDIIDWSQFAYCQYVTTEDYLCNSVMIFESLARLQSKADRLMMYPEQWSPDTNTTTGRLLAEARDVYNVHLEPVSVQNFEGDQTWAQSFTKLLAFNQTQYRRVLSLDSDGTVLQDMDSLFHLPATSLAAPRAYWLPEPSTLSSQLLLIQPSHFEFYRVQNAFKSRQDSDFDMEIINDLYNTSALILPHRQYDLVTGEYKSSQHNNISTNGADELDHSAYLGSKEAVWDPDQVINEARYVHFSDWPLPKPWIEASEQAVESVMPKCTTKKSAFAGVEYVEDCREREIWLGLYEDFRRRRARVCGL